MKQVPLYRQNQVAAYALVAKKAARAYDRAALRKHGEYAKTNFPRSDYELAEEVQTHWKEAA